MTKWTYYTQEFTLTELLNKSLLENLGGVGWELVCLLKLETENRFLAIFKQPIQDTPGYLVINTSFSIVVIIFCTDVRAENSSNY